jgi:3-oxoacyl-[acyl-carrier-protein] synthase-1
VPYFSSTKSLTGHALGAAGVHESIYTLLMMNNGFISATANVDDPDDAVQGLPLVAERKDDIRIDRAMSNSFGFGGTNCSLTFERLDS